MAWRGITGCGMIAHSMMWCTMSCNFTPHHAFCGTAWCSTAWCGVALRGIAWHCMACYGIMWHCIAWHGMKLRGQTRHGIAHRAVQRCGLAQYMSRNVSARRGTARQCRDPPPPRPSPVAEAAAGDALSPPRPLRPMAEPPPPLGSLHRSV